MFLSCEKSGLRRSVGFLALIGMMIVTQNTKAQVGAIAPTTGGAWSSSSSWTRVPTGFDSVYIGSAGTPAGAAMTSAIWLTANQDQSQATVFLGYGDGTSGTLQLGNFTLSAFNFNVGASGTGTGTVTRGTGTLAVTNNLTVNNSTFAFGGNDGSATLNLSNASATVAGVGNIRSYANIYNSSTLTLNSNLNLTNGLYLSNSTLNANGHNITTVSDIILNDSTASLTNRGNVSTNKLSVNNQAFNLRSTDSINILSLLNASSSLGTGVSVYTLTVDSSTATTASNTNVSNNVVVKNSSTLTLNADLNVASDLYIGNSTVNANGHNISAPVQIYLNDATALLTNRGNLNTPNLYVYNQNFDLRSTDVIHTYRLYNGTTTLGNGTTLNALNLSNSTATARIASLSALNLYGGSLITVKSGQTTGLTITGTSAGALNITDGTKLRLEIDGAIGGWALRWANPVTGGNHVADLNALITAGKIDFTLTHGGQYLVSSSADGFTYVLVPVPEPTTTMLIAVGGLASGWAIRRRRLTKVVAV